MRYQWIVLIGVFCCSEVFAEQTIINNYGTSPSSPPPANNSAQNNCGQPDTSHDQPIGTFSYNNNTTSGTIVTTGTKHPDLPGNNPCNNSQQPYVQPFVYAPVPNSGHR